MAILTDAAAGSISDSTGELDLRAGWEEAVRLRALVADRMLQLVAQGGGSDARLVLLLRQLADKFTRMKPAGTSSHSASPPCSPGYGIDARSQGR